MFPTTWYAPTFFSRTYWPRPSVRLHDAALVDFLPVNLASVLMTVEPSEAVRVSGDPYMATVDALDASVVSAENVIVVDSR